MLVRAFKCLSEAGLAMDTARLWGWLLAHRNHHSGVAETHPGLGELGGVSEVVAADAHSPEWDRVVAAGIRGWVSLVLVPCVSLPLVLRPVDDGGSRYLHLFSSKVYFESQQQACILPQYFGERDRLHVCPRKVR